MLPDGMQLPLASLGTLVSPACQPRGPWGGLQPGLPLSDYCSWPCKQSATMRCMCLQPREHQAGGSSAPSLPAVHLHRGLRAGGFACLPQHPAVPHHHHGDCILGCPSHPCSSLPSAAAAVPGNLSLKSINFSHTPREQLKNPSSLPPWLLSATIWHGPPRPPALRPPCL